jgi:hypothetical protein
VITDCSIGSDNIPPSQRILAECMETYGMEGDDPDHQEWVWNILSRQAVVYSCGAIGRAGDMVEHHHDPIELARCLQLSQAAAELMQGHSIGMGDEGDHELLPFYIPANAGTAAPAEITEDWLRLAFGGTIYPKAQMAIEPLEIGRTWWREVAACSEDNGENQQIVEAWQNLVQWFASQTDLHHPVFVSISNSWDAEESNGGCVLPRLAIALTSAGSLVGIISCVVHT